jgi:hypothetical protein
VQTGTRTAHVHEARLRLGQVDPAEVGAAVTTALCGHWGHEGPCRWPHNNRIGPSGTADVAQFRTVFVARAAEEAEVRALVNAALSGDPRWSVVESGARQLDDDERALGERLAQTPEP